HARPTPFPTRRSSDLAKSPAATMRKSAAHAATKSGLRASERVGAAPVRGSAAAEAGIENRIEEIHDEVQGHEGGREQQNHPLDRSEEHTSELQSLAYL